MPLPSSAVRDTLGAGPKRVWFFSSYHDGGNRLSEMHPCADWLSTHCPEVPPPVQHPWALEPSWCWCWCWSSSHPDHHAYTAQRVRVRERKREREVHTHTHDQTLLRSDIEAHDMGNTLTLGEAGMARTARTHPYMALAFVVCPLLSGAADTSDIQC